MKLKKNPNKQATEKSQTKANKPKQKKQKTNKAL